MPIAYPYKMSDWYGYNKNCSLTSFSSSIPQTSESNACGATINQTYYHNGSGALPAIGDDCYTNQNQTTVVAPGWCSTSSSGGFRIIGITGTVDSLFSCGVTVYSFSMTANYNTSGTGACGDTTMTTRYKDNVSLFNGVTIYTNSTGTTVFNGYNDYWSDGTHSFQVDSNGVIFNRQLC